MKHDWRIKDDLYPCGRCHQEVLYSENAFAVLVDAECDPTVPCVLTVATVRENAQTQRLTNDELLCILQGLASFRSNEKM